jgi:hypothetical protein
MILSIDIGLRNLALCIMSAGDKKDINSYTIHLWNVFNTLDSDDYKCQGIQKSGKICNKKCGYKYTLQDGYKGHSCKTHFPKTIKLNLKEHLFKKKMIDDYLLQDIAKIVLSKLQEIYNDNKVIFEQLTGIIIELQPKINRKAVFTSHLIYGKLVELYKDTKTTIRFVRASQKLKSYTGPVIECKLKGEYAKRKWLSIQYAKWFLENKFSKDEKDKWLPIFLTHTKCDDLSDVLLMDINSLHGIPPKQKFQKNGKCIK